MHIEFKKLHLHNFMSFGDAELIFENDGFIRVSGINENPFDNAGSNGSGKSSLWEGIIWAITGDTIRGTKQVVNIYGEDGCYVDIEFSIDNKQYHIIRAKDHKVYKSSLQIFIDGQDVSGKGLRDSEKLLQQYVPDLTSSLLGSVIILGQGLPQKFTNNTPAGRKEVLEKLSKSDFMIEDLKKRVSERKSEIQTNIRQFEDICLQNKTKQAFLTKQIEENKQLLCSLNGAELTAKLEELKQNQALFSKVLYDLEKELENQTTDYSGVSNKLNESSYSKNQELYSLKEKHEETIKPYSNSYNELHGELNSLKKQLNQIKSIKDVCPTCGQKIPDVHKPDTTMIELDIESNQAKLSEIENYLSSQDAVYRTGVNSINEKYVAQTQELLTKQEELSTKLKKLKSEISQQQATNNQLLSEMSSIEVKLAQLHTTIDNCNKVIRENNENLTIIEEDILYNNKQREIAQSHLDVISKFDTALKRDFRGYLLSTVIDYIQTKAMQYCKIIFDTTDIGFCLDGNNIDISYRNKAYENLSGGEKQKIDLIIQFSIRDMLSSQLNFTSNILVLDEVFDGLDTIGCNRVIDMISRLSDVKNVFIVTHRKDLSIPSDKEVIVAKSSVGISEIRK